MKTELLLELFISFTLIYACYTDIRWRRIPNSFSLSVLLLSFMLGCFRESGVSVFIPALMILTGFVLSLLGMVGAGDIKLISSLAVALSSQEIGNFLVFTGLAGIPLTIILLIYYRLSMSQKKITIPYGVAISFGYWLQWFFIANHL